MVEKFVSTVDGNPLFGLCELGIRSANVFCPSDLGIEVGFFGMFLSFELPGKEPTACLAFEGTGDR